MLLALFSSSSSFSTLRENQNDRKSETYILFILLQAAFSPNYRLKRRFTSELNLWHACVKKRGSQHLVARWPRGARAWRRVALLRSTCDSSQNTNSSPSTSKSASRGCTERSNASRTALHG